MAQKVIRCLFFTVILACSSWQWSCAYTVKGVIRNVRGCYYPRVYLEVINNINGIYGANFENLIASADIDSMGNFTITGSELPADKRYYRLFVTEDAGIRTSIQVGYKRNYFLLLLDNNSNVALFCEDVCKPNFSYTVNNSAENGAMAVLQNMMNGYYELYAGQDSMSKRKMEFVVNKETGDYKHFADTCKYTLVALLAAMEVGLKTKYNEEAKFFDAFGERLQKELPTSIYTKQYNKELQILNLKDEVKGGSAAKDYLIYAALLCSLGLNVFYFLRRKKEIAPADQTAPATDTVSDENRIRGLIESLSIKEREILLMINSGLSNKEIAASLNVEVSTVKTHVSNIYQKTSIKNRKEVAAIARYI